MLKLIQLLRARLRARPDTEHEQALIRLALGFVFSLYVLQDTLHLTRTFDVEFMLMIGVFQLLAVGLWVAVLASTRISPTRRVCGAVLDSAAASYIMVQVGVSGLPLYIVYLWIIFGNGFRYGKAYLLNALALSALGFTVVLFVNSFWREHLVAGVGLLIGMIAVSLYVLSLVVRLNDALQRAEAANLAKRQFVSTVSHEMRTPLNAIIGMLELLRDTSLTPEQGEMVNTVGASSRAMLGLVDDVLDFSKIEAGKLVLANEGFDLYALVNSVMQMLRPQAEGKGLVFVSSIMPDVPPFVRGDQNHLRQVLINLLANAVKFTENGGVTLHLSKLSEEADGIKLKFSIRDTGIGIASQDQRRIFESFTQADQSVTRRFGGTGLGTTIARQLVQLMNGRIGLESAVGLGSTFWFELPLALDAKREAETEEQALHGLQALAIGFPSAPLAEIQDMLRGWGVKAVAATTPEAAKAYLEGGERFSCALLYAPNLESADELFVRIRRHLSGIRLPVVLCAPAQANVHRVPIVHGSYTAVLALPAEKRLLYNALHAFTAIEHAEGVVFLSDYVKRKEVGQRLKILIADDNAVNLSVLAKILERANHHVTLAQNGEEALDAVEHERFDAAILDRNMPRMGGIEAVRAMRVLEMQSVRLPVVILSADVTDEARREAAEAGADLFLAKPVQATKLLEALLTLCERREESPAAGPVDVARQPGPVSAGSVLNYETLTLLEGLGSRSDFMEKLVRVFIDDNAELVEKMGAALEAKRFGEMRSLGHALKGSAGSIGADRLAQACSQLQECPEGDLRMRGKVHFDKLRSEFAAARTELTDYLRKRKSSAG